MIQLHESCIVLDADVDSPEEAIRLSGDILVKEGKIDASYVEEMLDGYRDLGPYFVLSPGIAMPHARPSKAVKELCMSFIRLKTPIAFKHPDNDPVQLVFAVAGVDKSSHIQMLRSFATVISDEDKLDQLYHAQSAAEIVQIFQQG